MMTNIISSTILDSKNNPIPTVPKDHYSKLDVFKERIIFTYFSSHLTKYNVLKYSEETVVYSFRKNRNEDYYLVGQKLDVDTRETIHLLDPLLVTTQTPNQYLEDQLIQMYNRISPTNFDRIKTLDTASNSINYPNAIFLYFPLFRHELPLVNDARQNPCTVTHTRTMTNEDALETLMTAIQHSDSMVNALRESKSLREFCDLTYPKTSLQTEEDYIFGSQVSLSWHLIFIDTGLTLSEQVRLESYFYNLVFQGLLNMFSFLLEWGTEADREYMLQDFLQTSYSEYERQENKPTVIKLETGYTPDFDVRRVSHLGLDDTENAEIASLIMTLMRENKVTSYNAYSILNKPVAEWFGKRNMQILSNSTCSKEDIQTLWVEAFGNSESAIIPEPLFENLPPQLKAVSIDFWSFNTNWGLWNNLKTICDFEPYSPYALKTIVGYDYETNTTTPLHDMPIANDLFIEKLDAAVIQIDSALKQLGLKVNQENRVAYLTMYKDDRNNPQSWVSLTWGVTEVLKISALNSLSGYSSDELKQFSELPDDLFYELMFDCNKPPKATLIIDEAWYLHTPIASMAKTLRMIDNKKA